MMINRVVASLAIAIPLLLSIVGKKPWNRDSQCNGTKD